MFNSSMVKNIGTIKGNGTLRMSKEEFSYFQQQSR